MIEDVYFLTVRAAPPHRSPTDFPLAAAAIVHARTLLHPALPQPDAGRAYRCLTEFPGRVPGCLVPLSDLDYELCGGRLWPLVGDRARILAALAGLTATPGRCDSLALPLVPWDDDLLNGGPYSQKRLLKAADGDYSDLIVTAEGTASARNSWTALRGPSATRPQGAPGGRATASSSPPLRPGRHALPALRHLTPPEGRQPRRQASAPSGR